MAYAGKKFGQVTWWRRAFCIFLVMREICYNNEIRKRVMHCQSRLQYARGDEICDYFKRIFYRIVSIVSIISNVLPVETQTANERI
jgi:hypothetical protein